MNDIAIRKRALAGDNLIGAFLNTGSAVLAEIAGRSGLDWCLLDMEHGFGSWEALSYQLMALEGTGTAPVVRLPAIDAVYIKRALDLGAHGLMLPNVNTALEAQAAVSHSRYPPHGDRGVSTVNRGVQYGDQFDERLETGHENTLIIAQIESPQAVENAAEIASVDGVDVLFIGPMDLSVSLGIPRDFDHPDYRKAVDCVLASAADHGKAAGTLGYQPEDVKRHFDSGFNFLAVGSDGSMVSKGMRDVAAAANAYRDR